MSYILFDSLRRARRNFLNSVVYCIYHLMAGY